MSSPAGGPIAADLWGGPVICSEKKTVARGRVGGKGREKIALRKMGTATKRSESRWSWFAVFQE